MGLDAELDVYVHIASPASHVTKQTILFLAANPLGVDRLALDQEARAIQSELERSGQRDRFELVTRWAMQPLDLLRELRRLKPAIVHFCGRGDSEGLYFQGLDGQPRLVSTSAVEETFGVAGGSVKLVLLAACYTESQAAALLAQVECVVGMRGAITDHAARSFAIGFYGGLGEGESVAAAYRQGCAAISLDGLADQDRPRLKARDDIAAETLVLAAVGSASAGTPRPMPEYPDAEVRALSERLDDARWRRDKLRDAGMATADLDQEILHLRRQLREGGQLRSGGDLGDGRYLLVKTVGRGGFAVVWEAYDRVAQRRVAIKVLHPNLAGDSVRRERFFRGANVMMRLIDPAVVEVLEPRGEDGGFHYFVMELVPGGNLREAVLKRQVRHQHLLSLILDVGEVLGKAHANQLIHRDIKPPNILLDGRGNAKLTDFDLVGAADTTGGTRTGALGTVVYAAPECLDRPQDATARADVYGLGMTAIFGLLGQELSLTTFRNPALTIAKLACSLQIREVLEKAVAWEPEHRFPDAAAMVAALRGALSDSEKARAQRASREQPCEAGDATSLELTVPEVRVDARSARDGTPSPGHSGQLDQTARGTFEKPTAPTSVDESNDCPVPGEAFLLSMYGLGTGKKFSLRAPQVVIGRSSDVDVRIDQEAVSRNHCKIVNTGNAIVLRDLGSTNGTYVNDELIDEYVLRDGDLIKIGRCLLKFRCGNNIEHTYHAGSYPSGTLDGLTQVFNRHYFVEILAREISRALHDRRDLSLLMLDVDQFKGINDKFGHLAGDYLLQGLASLIKAQLRREDVLARYGGGEFAIVLPGIDLDGAIQRAERIRRLVTRAELGFENQVVSVTVSIGASGVGSEPVEAIALVNHAETELHAAKKAGRNRVMGGILERPLDQRGRSSPGGTPMMRLKARLNDGSES